MYELMRWTGYLRIRHPQMRLFAFQLPIASALILTMIAIIAPHNLAIVGPSGILVYLLQMFSNLPGFFVAALAAIATFDRPGMDDPMPEPTPTLKMMFRGKPVAIELSRRMFLSYVFAYLTVLSLLVCVICVLALTFGENIEKIASIFSESWFGKQVISCVRTLALFALFSMLASIIVVTLQGLYFLTERMHQPNE